MSKLQTTRWIRVSHHSGQTTITSISIRRAKRHNRRIGQILTPKIQKIESSLMNRKMTKTWEVSSSIVCATRMRYASRWSTLLMERNMANTTVLSFCPRRDYKSARSSRSKTKRSRSQWSKKREVTSSKTPWCSPTNQRTGATSTSSSGSWKHISSPGRSISSWRYHSPKSQQLKRQRHHQIRLQTLSISRSQAASLQYIAGSQRPSIMISGIKLNLSTS